MFLLKQLPYSLILLLSITFITSIITYLSVRKIYKQYIIPSTSYTSIWRRALALVIDCSILIGICYFTDLVQGQDPHKIIANDLYDIIAISFCYYIPQLVSEYKATIGMRILRFKIYMSNLEKVEFWTLIGRYFASILLIAILVIILSNIIFLYQDQNYYLQTLLKYAPFIICITLVLHLFVIALNKKKQTLQDMIAKTVCINNK